MHSPYPDNIGFKLQPQPFSMDSIQQLKETLTSDLLINIYGLAGAGKGTLNRNLASTLAIPSLDSGLIHRALTYAYEDQQLECNTGNISEVFNQLEISLDLTGLTIKYDGRILSMETLRNPRISSRVAFYAQKDFEQFAFFDKVYEIISTCPYPVVLDGRGSNPNHVKKLSGDGYKIFRLLLEVSHSQNYIRYQQDYKLKHKLSTLDAEHDARVRQEFESGYIRRDEADLVWMEQMQIGIISNDSARLDTTELTPQQVLETTLYYLNECLIGNLSL